MENKKKVVFISVPMSGKDDATIKRNLMVTKRRYCKKFGFKAKDIDWIDNFHTIAGQSKEWNDAISEYAEGSKYSNLAYLGVAIFTMASVDEVVFGQDWDKAKGCIIEYQMCFTYGIPTVDVSK